MPWEATSSYRMNQGETGIVGIAVSPEMGAVLRNLGDRAAAHAASIAPRRTGEYARSFRVSIGTRGAGLKKRAQVTVVNVAPYAAALEWGNARTRRPPRVMGRTQAWLRATGRAR